MRKTGLPIHWITAIFKRFDVYFGAKWVAAADNDREKYLYVWSDCLDGFTGDEIKMGLSAAVDLDWPPSVGEFKKMCRPQPLINAQAYQNCPSKLLNVLQTLDRNSLTAKIEMRKIQIKLNTKLTFYDDDMEDKIDEHFKTKAREYNRDYILAARCRDEDYKHADKTTNVGSVEQDRISTS